MRIKTNNFQSKFFIGIDLLFLMLFSTSGFGQNVQKAVQAALKNNPNIKAQQKQVRAAEMQAEAAFGETLPELSMDASYNHVTDIPKFQIPFIGTTVKMGAYDKFDSGISLKYVLFSGFAQQNSISLKKQAQQLQGFGLAKIKKDIAFQTIAVYRKIQADRVETEILETSRKRIRLQLKRTRSLVKQGMMLALDTLNLSLALLDNEKKMLNARSSLETDAQQLQNLCGESVVPVNAIPTLFDVPLPGWQKEQKEQLQSLNTQKEMAQTSARLQQSAFYPKAVAQAAYRYGKPGLDVISNKWMHYGIWGIGLSWNLFHGRADQLKKEAALAHMEQISWQQTALNAQLQLRYEKALKEYEFLHKQYGVLQQVRETAAQKLKIIKSRYEQQVASVTDFKTAELELTEAELNASRMLLQILLKRNEIEYKSGKPISEWSLTQ